MDGPLNNLKLEVPYDLFLPCKSMPCRSHSTYGKDPHAHMFIVALEAMGKSWYLLTLTRADELVNFMHMEDVSTLKICVAVEKSSLPPGGDSVIKNFFSEF